jgi:DnaJ-class molecular chaperone
MWQRCSICSGTGNNNSLTGEIFSNICKTCNGKGIISELTGLPPSVHSEVLGISKNNFGGGDFRDDNMETQQEYYGK